MIPAPIHPDLRRHLRPVTWIEAPRLGEWLGVELLIASETFQYTGSFKYRAACHVALSVPHREILAASSGNFGQALASACQRLKKQCRIVMPENSAQVKINGVRDFGGEVDLIDPRQISRQARIAALSAQFPEAYVASAYDDPLVIAGNSTLGEELAARVETSTPILAPVGGGGLTAGIISGLHRAGCPSPVIGVEPLLANDAARSFRAGQLLANSEEPATIADGVRTISLGLHNWAILRGGLAEIIEVTEDQIREAVRKLFELANLKVEPTGALGVAALLAAPGKFQGRRVCCVVSGGNVDPQVLCEILGGES